MKTSKKRPTRRDWARAFKNKPRAPETYARTAGKFNAGAEPAVVVPGAMLTAPSMCVVLVGDVSIGFDVYGPFKTGVEAIAWRQATGVREWTDKQWFLMPLKAPMVPAEPYREDP